MNRTGRSSGNQSFQSTEMGPYGQDVTDNLIDALGLLEGGSIEDIRKAKQCLRSAITGVEVLGEYERHSGRLRR